jgi:hypothetical protein
VAGGVVAVEQPRAALLAGEQLGVVGAIELAAQHALLHRAHGVDGLSGRAGR